MIGMNVSLDSTTLAGITILVVDDVEEIRLTFSYLLEFGGATVDKAETAAEALSKVKSRHFDVILMDNQLPDKDGSESLVEIRQSGFKGPIIAITGTSEDPSGKSFTQMGFTAYLRKPVDCDFLISTISECLKNFPESSLA
jgi:CheY-like chemotaxis protein